MWDGPDNAELQRLQREEFGTEAAWKKDTNESTNNFKKFMKSKP